MNKLNYPFTMTALLTNALDGGLIFLQEFPCGMIAVLGERDARDAVENSIGEVRVATEADMEFVREYSNWPFLIDQVIVK
jgi:hypothetical protein